MPTSGGSRRAAKRTLTSLPVQTEPTPAAVLPPSPEEETQRRYQEYKEQHKFYLVQRLERRRYDNGRRGFDQLFECEYMGSAEFEFGAVPDSLARIREAGDLIIQSVEMIRHDTTKVVHFVGPRQGMNKKIADFREWFASPHLRCKEWTHFDELFSGISLWCDLDRIPTEAWWSLGDDIAWTLQADVAELLLEGFTPQR